MAISKARKEATKVSLVEKALAKADDFLTIEMVIAQCHGAVTREQASCSLHHLKKYRAADVMAAEGGLWWYSTPSTDTRTKHLDQRTPEERKRKPRRVRKNLAGPAQQQ
jgi:hypothetical protein